MWLLLPYIIQLVPTPLQQMQRKQLNSDDVQDLVKQAAKFNSRVLDDRARRVHLSDVNPAVS